MIPNVLSAKFIACKDEQTGGFALIPNVLSAKSGTATFYGSLGFALIPNVLSAKCNASKRARPSALP